MSDHVELRETSINNPLQESKISQYYLKKDDGRNEIDMENGKAAIQKQNTSLGTQLASITLIQKWCRHQYLKGLIPTILALWFWCLDYLTTNYEFKAVDYIRDQLSDYQCTTIHTTTQPASASCSSLNYSSEYYYYDDRSNLYLHSVSCMRVGVSLYYPNDFFDVYQSSYYLQLIINFLVPLFFTYHVYEFFILALHDCLVIVPGLNKVTKQPILQYAASPYRMGWFGMRELYKTRIEKSKMQEVKEGEEVVKGVKQPGIRIGRNTSIATNLSATMIVITIYSLLIDVHSFGSSSKVFRCMDVSQNLFNKTFNSLYIVLVVYIVLALIPTLTYYYQLFFYYKDIELLAYRYSQEFIQRRYQGIRNVFDMIPMIFLPTPFLLLYYLLFALPAFFCYCLLRFFYYLRNLHIVKDDNINGNSSQARHEQYLKGIFFPSRLWFCQWFLLPIDEMEFKEGDELISDVKEE